MNKKQKRKGQKECRRCDGRETIRVLSSGGDYEDWPCPECRQRQYEHDVALIYGVADGEAE